MKEIKRSFATIILFELIIVFVLTFLAATILKNIFQIDRPCAGLEFCEPGFSFPSRHATVAFGIVGSIAFYLKSRKLLSSLFVLAAAIGILRVIGNLHTIQDIIAGALIGLVIAYIVHKSLTRKSKR